jgi:gamma-glutamyltranspeptidase/glutathione hydrolase
MKKQVLCILVLIICFSFFIFSVTAYGGEANAGAGKPSEGRLGMVSSAHPLATRAGLEALEMGGNAFDAAVAVASTLNVVEPMMSGIGGYGTILIYDAEHSRIRFLDSSGKIPVNTEPSQFRPPTPGYLSNRKGAKAVSTPGNVNAWEAMSKNYGKLEWRQLFRWAIKAADEGFILDRRRAYLIGYGYPYFPAHARTFYGKKGRPLQEGERLIQKDLADTLRLIAKEGANAWYRGGLAKQVDAEMKRSGGFLSLKDLQDDKAEWWEPVSIAYRGFRVYTASPPSTAFPSLIRLGMMSLFKVKESGHNSLEMLHRFIEVTKIAFRCRLQYAGDPGVNPPPIEMLLSQKFWKEQAKSIDMKRSKPFTYPGLNGAPAKHTTHFVVADQWGNIVSATQTLGNLFGSRIMPGKTGVWLNNSLAYCTFEPAGNPMDAHPGRRKASGDCPTIIVKNGKPIAALGTPGGHTIGQTVPQMVMNLLDFDMDIHQAIAAARVSFVEPDTISVEEGVDKKVRAALEALGHKIRVIWRPGGLGNAHGLTIEYDKTGKPVRFMGTSDPRGAGLAKGIN